MTAVGVSIKTDARMATAANATIAAHTAVDGTVMGITIA